MQQRGTKEYPGHEWFPGSEWFSGQDWTGFKNAIQRLSRPDLGAIAARVEIRPERLVELARGDIPTKDEFGRIRNYPGSEWRLGRDG